MLTTHAPEPLETTEQMAVILAVLYRCTSFFEIDGSEHEQVFDQELFTSVPAVHKKLRRAAMGVAQALSRDADEVLQSWLRDVGTLEVLRHTVFRGGAYELELSGSGSRIVLSARPVLALLMVSRRAGGFSAALPHGRHLWSLAPDGLEQAGARGGVRG